MKKYPVEVRNYLPGSSATYPKYQVLRVIYRAPWSEQIGNFNVLWVRFNTRVYQLQSDMGDLSDPFRRTEEYAETFYIDLSKPAEKFDRPRKNPCRSKRGNPLTIKESRELLRFAHRNIGEAKDSPDSQANYKRGLADGYANATYMYGPRRMLKHVSKYGKRAGKLRRGYFIKNNPSRKNPGTKVGRRCILIQTTAGSVRPNGGAPIYGMKDGSLLIRGVLPNPPKGTVKRIEYLDEAKEKKEGLKPGTPWRHDFSNAGARIYRVKGGYSIRGRKPLWGRR